jgi:hypothetical protein
MAPKRMGKKERAMAVAAKREQIAAESEVVDAAENGDEQEQEQEQALEVGDVTPSAGGSAGCGEGLGEGCREDTTLAPPPSHEQAFEKALAGITLTAAMSKRGPRNSRGACCAVAVVALAAASWR